MAGFFGLPTPQEIQSGQATQGRQADRSFAALPPGRAGVQAGAQAGRQLGGALSTAIGGQDPQIKAAQARQQAMQEVGQSGLDITQNPEEFLTLASQTMLKYGDQEGATAAADQLRSIQAQRVKSTRENLEVGTKVSAEKRKQKASDVNDWYKSTQLALQGRRLDLLEKQLKKGKSVSPVTAQLANLINSKKQTFIEDFNIKQGTTHKSLEDLPTAHRLRIIDDLTSTINDSNYMTRLITPDLTSEITGGTFNYTTDGGLTQSEE